jgi:hypothetical protein
VHVDLGTLWQQLGVSRNGEQVQLSSSAQRAKIREAITAT